MKAIISRASASGQIATVGTTDRTLVDHYKTTTGVRRYALQYAKGKPFRIEFFHDDKFYGEPFRVEEYGGNADVRLHSK